MKITVFLIVLAFFTSKNHVSGQRIMSIATDDTNLLVGTKSDGLFVLNKHGDSLIRINNLFNDTALYYLAANKKIIVACTYNNNSGWRTLLSEDNGKKWSIIYSGENEKGELKNLIIDGNDIFGYYENWKNHRDYYHTTIAEKKWEKIKGKKYPNQKSNYKVTIGTNAYLIKNNSIEMSSDNGQNWAELKLVFKDKWSDLQAAELAKKDVMRKRQVAIDQRPKVIYEAVCTYYHAKVETDYSNFKIAINKFNSAIKAVPYFAEAFVGRGDCYFKMNMLDSAINDYLRADSFKKYLSTFNLAKAYASKGDKKSACKYLDVYLMSSSNIDEFQKRKNEIATNNKFSNLYASSEWKSINAKPYAAFPLNAVPEDSTAKAIISVQKDINQYKDQYLKYYYLDDKVWAEFGKVRIENKWEDGVSYLNEAIRINRKVPEYYLIRAKGREQLGHAKLAKADLDTALALDPKCCSNYNQRVSNAYHISAKSEAKYGSVNQAKADLDAALAFDPNCCSDYNQIISDAKLVAGNKLLKEEAEKKAKEKKKREEEAAAEERTWEVCPECKGEGEYKSGYMHTGTWHDTYTKCGTCNGAMRIKKKK